MRSSLVPPEVDIPALPTSIGIPGLPDSWQAWVMGAVVTIGLPFLTNKWGPLLGWMGKIQTSFDYTYNYENMCLMSYYIDFDSD